MQLVAKLTYSDIIHIIIAILYLHVYTTKLVSYTAGLSVTTKSKYLGEAAYLFCPLPLVFCIMITVFCLI